MPDFDLSENYHQGDISIDVPISVTVEVADPAPVETEPEPAVDCVQRDRDALVAFYNSLGGPNWRSSTGWLSAKGHWDAWRGVRTNSDGCVTHIELGGNDLSGTIPSEVGALSSLTVLNLRENNDINRGAPT